MTIFRLYVKFGRAWWANMCWRNVFWQCMVVEVSFLYIMLRLLHVNAALFCFKIQVNGFLKTTTIFILLNCILSVQIIKECLS